MTSRKISVWCRFSHVPRQGWPLTDTLSPLRSSSIYKSIYTLAVIRTNSVGASSSLWHITISFFCSNTCPALVLVTTQSSITKCISVSTLAAANITSDCVLTVCLWITIVVAVGAFIDVITAYAITTKTSFALAAIVANKVLTCGVYMTRETQWNYLTLIDIYVQEMNFESVIVI